MKVCSRCKTSKPVDEFFKWSRSTDGLQPACKSCMNESYVRSRNKRLDHYKTVQKLRHTEYKQKFDAWKETQKCAFCPEQHSCCLDLHHLDPKEKDATISLVVHSWSWDRLQREIQKCIVVCRNCHAKIHAGKIVVDNLP